ncbi:MAG: 3-deoxy-7-phosphoheptulonate synthase [Anaerolineae bacterium]|nr:3-deoxy-7-phosphoheptulonate synthase [Anaerolineae bacterium]MCA9892711.1 3-deoxy-7-phosphoheptulonate synthase [Anaerolineae bacterium]MCB9461670.1 3-deoxy-7-phosphoheptulonate synthase [Anaerolineaceae bacterium]
MIVVMEFGATAKQISDVIARIEADGYKAHLSQGKERTIIGLVGDSPTPKREENYSVMPGVDRAVRITEPYKLANRSFHPEGTLVPLNGSQMGGNKVLVIAGPCSVESREQIIETACAVKEAGATALRGGAFKPRTSPYSFQGHGEQGLKWMAEAREITGLPIVTEVMDHNLVPVICEYADVLQIGARNMQNFTLLNAVGESQHTVLLKRGMSSTVMDLLMAAEYVLQHGNTRVMLCERGIRTFETETRNTADINAIPALKRLTHLPVVFDPSHATGKWEYVEALGLAGIAAGADGLIVEVHPEPDKAISDGRQSLKPDGFKKMMERVARVAEAVGREA